MKYLSWSKRWSYITALSFAALLLSCGPELDLPEAPDVEPVLQSFKSPSAEVGQDIMVAVDEVIAQTEQAITESEFYEELLSIILDVQQELKVDTVCSEDSDNAGDPCTMDRQCPNGTCQDDPDDEGFDENGDLTLGGVVFPTPNGAVDVSFICGGWADPPPTPPDPANGTLSLNMLLTQGEIGALVWGSADNCRFLETTEIESQPVEVRVTYNGLVGVYFGEGETWTPDTSLEELYALPVVFIIAGDFIINDQTLPVSQAFALTFVVDQDEVTVGRIDILVPLDDGTDFVYFLCEEGYVPASPDDPCSLGFSQGVTDMDGSFGCRLEDEGSGGECFDQSGMTLFSW